jgi:hypothetical protein
MLVAAIGAAAVVPMAIYYEAPLAAGIAGLVLCFTNLPRAAQD